MVVSEGNISCSKGKGSGSMLNFGGRVYSYKVAVFFESWAHSGKSDNI